MPRNKRLALLLIALLIIGKSVVHEETNFISPIPDEKKEVQTKVDPRVETIKKFLISYDSPLADNAQDIVDHSEANGIDPYLLVAITGVESSFCKHIPTGSNNCMGWGIYGGNVTSFDSYEEAISTVARGLASDRYRGKSIKDIAKVYSPRSESWARNVKYFMDSI